MIQHAKSILHHEIKLDSTEATASKTKKELSVKLPDACEDIRANIRRVCFSFFSLTKSDF